MGKVDHCDVCKKPATIVAKLFIGPARSEVSTYTATAEVGECCLADMNRNIAWTKRKKYQRKSQAAKKRHEKPAEAVV